MMRLTDEGFIDDVEEDVLNGSGAPFAVDEMPMQQREELVYKLLASMPRAQIARVHRRIAPCVQVDIVGIIPSELALLIFSHLPWQSLLKCALVSRRWRTLADDHTLWKGLCAQKGWEWRWPPRPFADDIQDVTVAEREEGDSEDFDDEGMGDDEDSGSPSDDGDDRVQSSDTQTIVYEPPHTHAVIGLPSTPRMHTSMAHTQMVGRAATTRRPRLHSPSRTRQAIPRAMPLRSTHSPYNRHSAPSALASGMRATCIPDYKLLHQTHVLLANRMRHGAFRFSTLQTRGAGPPDAHGSLIYCLQLHTYSFSAALAYGSGQRQVLFTGGKDRAVREWNLATGVVERVFEGVHEGSVLSLCANGDYLATGGSDWRVCVWDLRSGALVQTIKDHTDSVLCVRFDSRRLVSCSKDRTVRLYQFENSDAPEGKCVLSPGMILGTHRAAVNAVSLAGSRVISASGDKSLRIWDARTGALLRTLEGHHARGIAALDAWAPPEVESSASVLNKASLPTSLISRGDLTLRDEGLMRTGSGSRRREKESLLVLSGSSDRHVRLYDVGARRGWSSTPEFHDPLPLPLSADGAEALGAGGVCKACGNPNPDRRLGVLVGGPDAVGAGGATEPRRASVAATEAHTDLVRSVALGANFVVSGSYDQSIKVWDRETGYLVADLSGRHEGRVFCVGFDCTKIVSCGEDQKICIWDLSYGIDTSFIKL